MANIFSNALSNIGSGIQEIGSSVGLPELGISELFGVGNVSKGAQVFPTGDRLSGGTPLDPQQAVLGAQTTAPVAPAPIDTAPIDTTGTGGTPETTFQPVAFRGAVHSTPESLKAAMDLAAVDEFETRLKDLNRQKESGLISFDEFDRQVGLNRQSISKQRDDALAQTSGFFSAVSPGAFQSQQARAGEEIGQDFTQAGQNLDVQQAQGTRGREDLGINFANQLQQAEQLKQANLDAATNFQIGTDADQAAARQSQASVAANAPQFSQVGLVNAFANSITDALSSGAFSRKEAFETTRDDFRNQGVSDQALTDIEKRLEGLI